MRGRWITPGSMPEGTKCWSITLPDSVDFLAIFKGAIDDLRFSSNFEDLGGITSDDAAAAFAAAFDTWAECEAGGNVIGTVFAYATTNPPSGSLACDGASYLRVDYPDLYSVLASAFITDADHFVVPDLRGRSPLGIGSGAGLTTRAMKDSGGTETQTLTEANLAAHHHSVANVLFGSGGSTTLVVRGAAGSQSSQNTGDTGSGTGHNNMQPFLALGFAIQAE